MRRERRESWSGNAVDHHDDTMDTKVTMNGER